MSIHAPGLQDLSRGTGAAAAEVDAPPAIDLVHLARQTLGDKDLELELLGLFARQARSIVEALTSPKSGGRLSLSSSEPLHTLCGSARAIGAWSVAAEAQRLEQDVRAAVPDGVAPPQRDRLATLHARVHQACAVIDHLLQDQE